MARVRGTSGATAAGTASSDTEFHVTTESSSSAPIAMATIDEENAFEEFVQMVEKAEMPDSEFLRQFVEHYSRLVEVPEEEDIFVWAECVSFYEHAKKDAHALGPELTAKFFYRLRDLMADLQPLFFSGKKEQLVFRVARAAGRFPRPNFNG